jgi:hypothetical protein
MDENNKKDILKELGLRLEFERNIAKVYNSNDGLVGLFPFDTYDQPYKNIKVITPTDSKVANKYQGKGIASEVYKKAEEHFKAKVIPDDEQSYQGNLLHEKYGQGKKFGVSSSELDSNLTKKERVQRHSRQKALNEIMTEIADNKYGDDVDVLSKFGSGRRNISEVSEKIRKNAPSRNVISLLNNAVGKSWDEASQKINRDKLRELIPLTLSRVKSVTPMLLKGAAAGATAGLSLASEAADTEEFGDAPEQAALQRESDEYNRRKKTLSQYPEASQMYDELDQGKAFDARRDALLKLTQK